MSVVEKIKEHWFKVVKDGDDSHTFLNDQERQYYIGLRTQMPKGKEYWIGIKEQRPTRTMAQNNYYWLYLNGLEKELGYTSDELHEYYKQKFLSGTQCEVNGDTIRIYPSTTKLTIKEFMEYIRNIEVHCGTPAPDTRLCGLFEHISKAGMLY